MKKVKMKGILFAAGCLGIWLFLNGCYKSYSASTPYCSPVPTDQDSADLLKFAHDHMIDVTKDPSGLYYQIVAGGWGQAPKETSTIYVSYVGKRMDGTTFDSVGNSATTGWVLNTLLDGWQIGMTKITSGGHIKLLLPSALAYKCMGTGDGRVMPNAPVYYDVVLVSFK
jgi:FKBP-type peptidyl-prolyl cis-trans isomerase FkpA